MTDNIEPDKKIEGTKPPEDEEIIELKEEIIDVSKKDEEIINLLDAVEEPPIGDERESVIAGDTEPPEDEEILELTEEITDAPQEIEEIGEPIYMTADTSAEIDVSLDLEGDFLEETVDFHDKLDEEVTLDQTLKDDFVDSLGMDLDSEEDDLEDLSEVKDISNEQMEAALERVIKNMFYEKIDRILVEVIEKTVTKEIERLKGILLEDAASNKK